MRIKLWTALDIPIFLFVYADIPVQVAISQVVSKCSI